MRSPCSVHTLFTRKTSQQAWARPGVPSSPPPTAEVPLALRIAIVSGEPGHAACVHDQFTITAAHVPSTNRMLIYHERHLQSVLGEYAPGDAFAARLIPAARA